LQKYNKNLRVWLILEAVLHKKFGIWQRLNLSECPITFLKIFGIFRSMSGKNNPLEKQNAIPEKIKKNLLRRKIFLCQLLH